MTQVNKDSHIDRGMGAYDKENALAWSVIMDKVRSLRERGETLHVIGKRLGVGRDTVSRWVSEERGGERTTFGAMLRYAKALRIPFEDLISGGLSAEETLIEPAEWSPSPFEKQLAATLSSGAQLLGKTPATLAAQIYGSNNSSDVIKISQMLSGELSIGIEDFFKICNGIGLPPADVLNRVAELTSTDHEGSTRRTA